MTIFEDVYKNRRVLLTGHTGFKGSWLALWLKYLGAKIIELALTPSLTPSHWDLISLNIDDRRVDVREFKAVSDTVNFSSPEIFIHLAVQPLMHHSYKDPLETWSTAVLSLNQLQDYETVASQSGLK